MGDPYDSLAKRFGFPAAQIADWRKVAGAPPTPSYEGATLQNMAAPPIPAPAGPPPPRPSYEGATLQNMPGAPTGVHLADPIKPGPGTPPKPTFRLATGDNLAPAPAAVKPSVMAQINHVADNSDKIEKAVKGAVAENDRAKNLEGATFADSSTGSAGGTPVLVDKGGRRPASWQVQEGMDLGSDAERAVTSADEHGRTGAGLDYMAGTKAADYERGYLERHDQASKAYAAEEQNRSEKYTQQVDQHMANLDGLRAKIREAKIDPYDGMNPMASKIIGAVAIGLGAFASRHGENAGLEAVKQRIGENVQRQQEELNKLERGARGESTFLGQLKAQYGDIGVAKEAARIAYLEQAKVELAKHMASPEVADPRLQAGYERFQAKLDDELVQRTAHFRGITQDKVVRHDINAQAKYAGGMTPEAKHDARYLSESYEKAGLPASLSELKDVDRVIDAFGDGDIPGVGPIMGKVPAMLLGDRAIAGRQAVQSIKNSIGHARFGGALSPTEAEKLDAQLDGAKDSASLRRTVQSLRQALQHRAANIAAGASPEGVDLYEQRGGAVQRGPTTTRQVALDKPSTPTIREAK